MYVGRHHHVDHEMLRWLILILLAGSLLLFTTRATNGEAFTLQPLTSSDRLEGSATFVAFSPFTNPMPTADRIWRILEDHKAGHLDAAIDRWDALELDDDAKTWRAVAKGSAYIKLVRLDDAERLLATAIDEGFDNAVTHHLMGVVMYVQSNDVTRADQPAMADALRHQARTHFQKSISMYCLVDPDEPLSVETTQLAALGPFDTINPADMLPPSIPRVKDLLSALRLTDFNHKSHVGLLELNLAEGRLADAERVLDSVTLHGESMSPFYLSLGDEYAKRGEQLSATRAYMKAVSQSEHKGSALMRAMQRLRR